MNEIFSSTVVFKDSRGCKQSKACLLANACLPMTCIPTLNIGLIHSPSPQLKVGIIIFVQKGGSMITKDKQKISEKGEKADKRSSYLAGAE